MIVPNNGTKAQAEEVDYREQAYIDSLDVEDIISLSDSIINDLYKEVNKALAEVNDMKLAGEFQSEIDFVYHQERALGKAYGLTQSIAIVREYTDIMKHQLRALNVTAEGND